MSRFAKVAAGLLTAAALLSAIGLTSRQSSEPAMCKIYG
jgi:hypothetical protein